MGAQLCRYCLNSGTRSVAYENFRSSWYAYWLGDVQYRLKWSLVLIGMKTQVNPTRITSHSDLSVQIEFLVSTLATFSNWPMQTVRSG